MCILRHCCGQDLQSGAVFTAILNIVGGGAACTEAVFSHLSGGELEASLIGLIFGAFGMVLGYFLLVAAAKEWSTAILVWLVLEMISLLVGVLTKMSK